MNSEKGSVQRAASATSNVATASQREEATLAFWNERKIFEKSLTPSTSSGQAKPEYVFYDGPPFATGTPHYVGMMNYTGFPDEVVIQISILRFLPISGNIKMHISA